jgi:hypothetical protein
MSPSRNAAVPVWGCAGRTLSGAVSSPRGTGWLRVVVERPDKGGALGHDPDLPEAWWVQLRTALDSLAEVPTERIAVREEYIRRAVPAYTGCDVGEIEWSTAHGDFHWSNLGGPDLAILDWEGWGTAPVAFDAAQLYLYSLHTPATAARVRQTFTHPPSGLCGITAAVAGPTRCAP